MIFKWDPKIHGIRYEKHKTNINRELITSINITHGDDLAHLRYLDQRPLLPRSLIILKNVCVLLIFCCYAINILVLGISGYERQGRIVMLMSSNAMALILFQIDRRWSAFRQLRTQKNYFEDMAC